jgi:hypothetical protein
MKEKSATLELQLPKSEEAFVFSPVIICGKVLDRNKKKD